MELPTAWVDAEDHCFFRSGSDASQLEEATWVILLISLFGRETHRIRQGCHHKMLLVRHLCFVNARERKNTH